MLKKISLFTACFFLSHLAQAETCPTLSELKSHAFMQKGWQALDIDNAEPLSKSELKAYQRKVESFSKATWLWDAPEGAAQCYYNGDDQQIHMGVFIVKQTLPPDESTGHWQGMDGGMSCEVSLGACRYKDSGK